MGCLPEPVVCAGLMPALGVASSSGPGMPEGTIVVFLIGPDVCVSCAPGTSDTLLQLVHRTLPVGKWHRPHVRDEETELQRIK